MKPRKLMLVARLAALTLIIYFSGVRLAQYIAFEIYPEMPEWMYDAIRYVLDHTGDTDVRDPLDLSTISLLCTLVASWIMAAVVVIVLYRIVWKLANRYIRKRSP